MIGFGIDEEYDVVNPGKMGGVGEIQERGIDMFLGMLQEKVVGNLCIDVLLNEVKEMEHDKVEEKVCHWHSGSGALPGLVNVGVVLVGEGSVGKKPCKMLEWIW